MLTIWGDRHRFCEGIGRRAFLKIGAFGGAFTLADLLRRESPAATPRRLPRKAAIHIVLAGGPPHLDMFDMKPDAPAEIRGEFKPIATSVPGVQICELMPKLARMWDKLAVIRSLTSTSGHDDAEISTGYNEIQARAAARPSFGAVVSKLSGPGRKGIPPFISLRPRLWTSNPAFDFGNEPGFLGPAHRAFTPDGPGTAISNEASPASQNRIELRPTAGVTLDRLADRRALLTAFDVMRRDADAGGAVSGMDALTARAFEIITSDTLRDALDLSKESPAVHERYGRNFYYDFPDRRWETNYGAQALAARRLVEAGAGCVTIGFGNWDTHVNNFGHMRRQLPPLDSAVSALVEDLHERGMDKDVAVVVWGEFGRTPAINKDGGRDHWGPLMSALVAGGGLKMGQAIGTSDARGERPTSRPYTISNVLSTLYQAIGIDPAQTFINHSGRPTYILDDQERVAELV